MDVLGLEGGRRMTDMCVLHEEVVVQGLGKVWGSEQDLM